MIAAFGMVTGGQIADLLPEGNVMQVEAGSRKQIIKVKNKGKDSKKEFDKDKDNAKDNEKDLVEEGEKEDRKDLAGIILSRNRLRILRIIHM